jgi:hypothetical protein
MSARPRPVRYHSRARVQRLGAGGRSPRQPRPRSLGIATIAEALEELPLLRAAAETGTIAGCKLREIVRKASEETEARWLDSAERYNARIIARLVSQCRDGELPPSDDSDDRDPVESRLTVVLTRETMELFQRANQQLSEEAGRRLSMEELFQSFAMAVLAGSPFPEEDAKERILAAIRKDVAAQAEPTWVAPWVAVAATEESCPTDSRLEVARQTPAHWANPSLRFSGTARAVTPKQREEIVRRDAYRCSNPCCHYQLWLEVHHIVFFCNGGATVPDNLLTLCSRCHRNLHEGKLHVTGPAPRELVWTNQWGEPLGTAATVFACPISAALPDGALTA